MERKIASGIMLTLLLTSMLTLALGIQPVKAAETIYIRADGSVDPPTAPISTFDNVTYTLTENITSDVDGILVERGNIIIDGRGYTLQGTGSGNGFHWSETNNVTVRNANIEYFYHGILVLSSDHNSFSGNKITSNDGYGISLESCLDNSVSGNNVTDNGFGIGISYSDGNIVSGNNVASNSAIDIDILVADNNIISGNNVTNSDNGIGLWDAQNNTVSGNNIINNGYGIPLVWSSGNRIIGNNVANNGHGISFDRYFNDDNVIYHNNFISNTEQTSGSGMNAWDDGYPSGGNYWSDYLDVDLYEGPGQNETGGDGIWDHPYFIDADNQDQYPFINPWHAAPIISLSQTPDYPLPAQKVKIYAQVIESTGAGGVAIVFFSYRANGDPWWNTTMVFNSGLGLYETTIPAYEKHDLVEYFVKAVDNAGKTSTTAIRHYEVLRCDVSHNGIVDVWDIYMIGKAWNTRTWELGFIAEADINEDGIIDNQDLALVNSHYGKDP